MALTTEEQSELVRLKKETAAEQQAPIVSQPLPKQPLSEQEQAELSSLRKDITSNQLLLIQQIDQSRKALKKREVIFGVIQGDPQSQRLIAEEQQAFVQLKATGATDTQINQVLAIQQRVNPGIIQQMKNNFGEDLGGLLGGAAGAKLALALGQVPPFTALPEEFLTVPLFAGIGSFVFGGTGKNIQQAINPFESPTASAFLRSGTRQAAFETGGRLLKPIAKVAGLGKVIDKTDEVQQLFKDQGGFFTPRQRDPRIAISIPEELSRGSFGGGQIFDGYTKEQQAQALEVGKKIVDVIAGDAVRDPDVLGKELAEIFVRRGQKGVRIKGSRQTLLDTFFDPLFDEVSRLSPNTRLSTLPIKDFITRKLKEDLDQGSALLTKEGRAQFKRILKTLKTQRTLGQMRSLVSSYKKDARKFAVGADKSETAFIELAGIADQALFNPSTVKGMTPAANKLLRNINVVYGPSRELYEDLFVKSVVSRLVDSPSTLNKVIYKDFDFKRLKGIRDLLVSPIPSESGIGATSKSINAELRSLRQTLPGIKGGQQALESISKNAAEGKALWKQLNAAWFASQLDSAFNPTTGILDIIKLDKAFEKIPDNTFRLMFPGMGGKVKGVQELFRKISPSKKGFVSMFGKTIELGGIAGIGPSILAGSGIGVTMSGALAISPTAFAKLATNPKATKALTLGITSKAGTVNTAALAARLINLLNEDALRDQRAILKEKKRKRRTRQQQQLRRELPIIPFAQ